MPLCGAFTSDPTRPSQPLEESRSISVPFVCETINMDLHNGVFRVVFDVVLFNNGLGDERICFFHRAGLDQPKLSSFIGLDTAPVPDLARSLYCSPSAGSKRIYLEKQGSCSMLRRGLSPAKKVNWLSVDIPDVDELTCVDLDKQQRKTEIPPYSRFLIGPFRSQRFSSFRLSAKICGESFYRLISNDTLSQEPIKYFSVYGILPLLDDIEDIDLKCIRNASRRAYYNSTFYEQILPNIIVPASYDIILPRSRENYRLALQQGASTDITKYNCPDPVRAHWLSSSSPDFAFGVEIVDGISHPLAASHAVTVAG